MSSLQPVRGTHDLLPEAQRLHRLVVDRARAVTELYGFDEVATPIFEKTEVFKRTLGDTSDIVTKEMYSFCVKEGGDGITLRPEGTAGIARSFISNNLSQNLPVKHFYAGPMFRYERPQKGRQRQFHQVGAELLGVARAEADVEVISMAVHVLKALGVYENTTLELNTLGDAASRTDYRKVLVEYFTAHKAELSEDSFKRLDKNPLRILDSKDEGDREIIANAPLFGDYLNDESRSFFAALCEGLKALEIPFVRNERLVRGLDYYCHTAFEFVTPQLGAQGTVLAGGRYDALVKMMGGPDTAGVGWSAGVERLCILTDIQPQTPRLVALIPMGEKGEKEAMLLASRLRFAGFRVDLGFSGALKKRLARANKAKASVALLLGDDELAQACATVRDLESGEQRLVSLDKIVDALHPYR